jgi:hypothetical protein
MHALAGDLSHYEYKFIYFSLLIVWQGSLFFYSPSFVLPFASVPDVKFGSRVENLSKFRDAQDGAVPALVCTDLAARGLDLVVDHVIMFDFPYNPVSYHPYQSIET